MSIDILRGFNRIKIAIQCASIAIFFVFLVIDKPRFVLSLETSSPTDTWHIASKDCEFDTDAVEWVDVVPASISNQVSSIELCFRATEVASNPFDQFDNPVDNKLLVPYKQSKLGYFIDGRYSNNVQNYTKYRVKEFSVTPQIETIALSQAETHNKSQKMKNFKDGAILLILFLLLLEISGRLLGWIIRGFIKADSTAAA